MKNSLVLQTLHAAHLHSLHGWHKDAHRLMLTVQEELKPFPISHIKHGLGVQAEQPVKKSLGAWGIELIASGE